jgi:hypothetical protein
LNYSGNPIATGNLKWFRNGSGWYNGIANFTASVAELSTGTLNIRLEGTDEYGTSGSVTHTIVTGFDLPLISSPASGTRYAIGSNVNFAGTPDSAAPITMLWYLDYGLPGESYLGAGSLTSAVFATRGLKNISYLATDSASTFRSHSIQILVNNSPTVAIAQPLSGGKYFGGQDLAFAGSGNNSGGTPLDSTSFRWFRGTTLLQSGADNITATVAQLPTGTHLIGLHGTDEFGDSAGATRTIQVGFELPVIASPASGTRYAIGSTVNFAGTPDSSAPINMCGIQIMVCPASPILCRFSYLAVFATRGLKNISYLATDSANTLRSGKIQILVNNQPTLAISQPINGGKYFGGQDLVFSGSGNNSGGVPLDSTAFKWFRGTNLLDAGADNITATIAQLPTGTHQIGLHGTDEFGDSGGATRTIQVGFDLPNISSPASGSRYAIGSTVNFTGSPDSSAPITMLWYADYGLPCEAYLGAGSVTASLFASRGLKTITYLATDSANTLRSRSIQILVNNLPTMTISQPVNGGKYFGGQNLAFAGSGTDAGGGAINAANMKWYRGSTLLQSGVDSFPATVADLPTGTHQIVLYGTDSLGDTNSATHSITVGFELPQILSPASGTRFAPGDSIAFNGSPDSSAPINMLWYENYGLPGEQLIGNGATISHSFAARGIKTVSYLATDSANTLRTSTVQVLVNNPPTFTITSPVNNGCFFGGQSISFSGSGQNMAGDAIDVASLKWYRDGSLWKTGVSAFAATVAELSTGTHEISLAGVDEFGTPGCTTYTIQVGFDLPLITSPASGTRFDTGTSVAFTGTPDLTGLINMEWYWSEGTAVFGNGPSANIATLTRGWQTISYRGTDSQGTVRTNSKAVLIDKLPIFTSLPFISRPAKYADGQLLSAGVTIPIHLASAGTSVDFSVAGQNELGVLIPPASITWLTSGTVIDTVATLTRNFENPGSYTYSVQISDDFGQQSVATLTFWIWDTETYHGPAAFNSPTAIINSGNTQLFVADTGNSRIVKLNRKTSGLTEIGDINEIATATLVASCTHPFVDLALSGGTLFSLGALPGTSYRIQTWETGNLHSLASDFVKTHGTAASQFDNALGLSIDAGAIYVSDFGNNKIKKLDINNGLFYSQSQNVANPAGIKYINASTLFVAENGLDRLLKFESDLNNVATWNSQTANNATMLAYSPTSGNLYVTDPSSARVNVVASSGLLLYSFGKTGTTPDRGEFTAPYGIVIVDNDLYVTDNVGDTIVRFRTGSW